jgi:hypothetical protein
LAACVHDKATFCKFRNLQVELIIVEWNPPADKPRLREAITWPRQENFSIKIITVPQAVHNKVYNPGKFSFLEYAAKNVGIRRARGEFILSTNADVLFSGSMSARLAKQDFSEGHFYRANRHDLDEYGRVFQINYANGTFPPYINVIGQSKTGVPYRDNMPHFNASGDFMMMSRDNWHRLRGYPENRGYLITLDGEMVYLALSNGLSQVILPEAIYHQYHHHGGADQKPWYMPPQGWSDAKPRGKRNVHDDWGFALENLEIVECR